MISPHEIIEGQQAAIDRLKSENAQLKAEVSATGDEAERLRGERFEIRSERDRLRRQCDRLAGASRLAVEFLSEVVAYGLARQQKGEVGEALRAALAGLDGEPGGEGRDAP